MANALVNIRFIENSRGSQTLVLNGYMYSLKTRKRECRYWNCVNKACNAKINTKNELPTKLADEHNHPRDDSRIVAADIMSGVRKQVRGSTQPVPSIYNDMLADTRSIEWDNSTQEVVANLPTFYEAKSSLYRQRSKTRPVLPKTRADVNLEGKWIESLAGEPFLIANDGDVARMLIFATVDNLAQLSTAETWYMDGTFYASPSYFYQLYTIHAMIDGYMCPLVYGLLPNKQQTMYTRFFTLIQNFAREHNIPLSPETIMMDFETAAWRAVSIVFVGVQVRGCFFHFTQCMWRKVQYCGLVADFKDNEEVKKLVLRASVLPLVPLASVEDVWFQTLEECDNDSVPVSKFKDYVTEQWVEGDRRSWNHYENDGPRTTNHVEGWHHKINNQLRHCHPNIYTLIDLVQKEQAANEAKLFQHANGGKQRPRKRVYREREQMLIRLKHQLRTGDMDIMTYVDAASHLVKLK